MTRHVHFLLRSCRSLKGKLSSFSLYEVGQITDLPQALSPFRRMQDNSRVSARCQKTDTAEAQSSSAALRRRAVLLRTFKVRF